MINSHLSPGPALWQGIMFIIVFIWFLYLMIIEPKKIWPSLLVVIFIGIVLMIGIINYE